MSAGFFSIPQCLLPAWDWHCASGAGKRRRRRRRASRRRRWWPNRQPRSWTSRSRAPVVTCSIAWSKPIARRRAMPTPARCICWPRAAARRSSTTRPISRSRWFAPTSAFAGLQGDVRLRRQEALCGDRGPARPGVGQRRAQRLTLKTLFADRILAMALTQGIAGPMPQVDAVAGRRADEGPACTTPRSRYCRSRARSATAIVTACKSSGPTARPPSGSTRRTSSCGASSCLPTRSASDIAERTAGRSRLGGGRVSRRADQRQGRSQGVRVRGARGRRDRRSSSFRRAPRSCWAKRCRTSSSSTSTASRSRPNRWPARLAVLDFWATWCRPCKQSLPNLEKVYQQYKDNPKVAFYAVSVDQTRRWTTSELVKTFEDLKVHVPILRDTDKTAAALKFTGIPTMFIIGPDGVVQDCEAGLEPETGRRVAAKTRQAAGRREHLRKAAEGIPGPTEAIRQDVETRRRRGRVGRRRAGGQELKLPEAKTAPRSQPTAIKLTSLWKCADVKSPGNILVLGDKNGPARLAVVENWKSVAEVGLDGKLIALHKLNLADSEAVGSLRSAVGADGKRWLVAFLPLATTLPRARRELEPRGQLSGRRPEETPTAASATCNWATWTATGN